MVNGWTSIFLSATTIITIVCSKSSSLLLHSLSPSHFFFLFSTSHSHMRTRILTAYTHTHVAVDSATTMKCSFDSKLASVMYNFKEHFIVQDCTNCKTDASICVDEWNRDDEGRNGKVLVDKSRTVQYYRGTLIKENVS